MALHPETPDSPYAPLIPSQRWFPADEMLRGASATSVVFGNDTMTLMPITVG